MEAPEGSGAAGGGVRDGRGATGEEQCVWSKNDKVGNCCSSSSRNSSSSRRSEQASHEQRQGVGAKMPSDVYLCHDESSEPALHVLDTHLALKALQ